MREDASVACEETLTVNAFWWGCHPLSLRTQRRGFHVILNMRPSSLFMLLGCSSSSVAFLMSQSMQIVLVERILLL